MKRWLTKNNIMAMLACVLIFVAAAMWFLSETKLSEGIRLTEGFSQLRLSDSPVTPAAVEAMINSARDNYEPEYQPRFTGWTQQGALEVENPDLGRRVELDVVFYYGEGSRAMDGFSDSGCILSRETADSLFGTVEVPAGTEILVDGERYHVEKVADQSGLQLAVRLAKDAERELDVLDVYSKALSRLEFSTETVVVANGLKSRTNLEYDGLFAAGRTVRNLPLWILILVMAVFYARGSLQVFRQKGVEGSWQEGLAKGGFAVLLILGGVFLLGNPVSLPQRFVPTMWSDFSFWTEAFSDLAEQARLVMTMELYQTDQYYRTILIGAVVYGWLAALCLGAALAAAKPFFLSEAGPADEPQKEEADGVSDTEEHREGI